MTTFRVQPARDSQLAKVPFKVILVDYHEIGSHEHIRHPEAVEQLVGSMLAHGYQGPPLAVFQAGSDDWFDNFKAGQTITPRYGELGIADGHHRLQAITILGEQGLLHEPIIPVQIIPGRQPSLVRLATMHAGEEPLPITAIEACFADPGAAIPRAGTTHFQAHLNDGQWLRLAQSQPDIVITRDDLVQHDN